MIELLSDELSSGLTRRAIAFADLVGELHQFASNDLRLGKAIGGLVGQHVPDGHQQFAGDRDNGSVATQAGLEACQFRLPVGVGIACHLCRFHQGSPQILATGLGDATSASGETAVLFPQIVTQERFLTS